MNEPKDKSLSAGPAQGPSGSAKNAEKVRSSRYEWEDKSDAQEPAGSRPSHSSLMTALAAWVKKFFSFSRDYFDKDDDATPSAA